MSLLKSNKHANTHLQLSYNKHGGDNFKFIILEECNDLVDIRDLELAYIKKYNVLDRSIGYNKSCITKGIYIEQNHILKYTLSGEFLGEFKDSVEATSSLITSSKYNNSGIRACASGKYRYYLGFVWIFQKDYSKEYLEKRMFLANNKPRVSEETRQKMRDKKLGKKQSLEHRLKCSIAHKGKTPKNLESLREKIKVPVYVYDLELNLAPTP